MFAALHGGTTLSKGGLDPVLRNALPPVPCTLHLVCAPNRVAEITRDRVPPSLQVLNLLLDMPGGFAEVLLEHGCLPRILQMVELQLVRQAFHEG